MVIDRKDKTRSLVIAGIMAALVFVITRFLAIPVPSMRSYINLGDSVIYCMGLLLGGPWAAVAAALGSGLADWAMGFPIYIPATIVIKGLMGFLCATLMKNGKFPRFIIVSIIAGIIMVVGYAGYEYIIMNGWSYVVATLIPNTVQLVGGVLGGVALYYPVKRIMAAI